MWLGIKKTKKFLVYKQKKTQKLNEYKKIIEQKRLKPPKQPKEQILVLSMLLYNLFV